MSTSWPCSASALLGRADYGVELEIEIGGKQVRIVES